MRLIRVLTFLFLLAGIANAQSTTAITGTFRDLTGSLITSGQVAFTLQPGIDTQVSGTARFTPTEVDCLINGSGLLKALDGTSTCTLVQNTSITTPANTSWKACVQPGFIQPGSCFVFYAVGSTLDITTVPATPSLTPAYSLVDIFSNQTIGGNKTFSGIVGFTGTLNVGALTLSSTLAAAGITNTGDYINCATCTAKWGSSGISSPDLGISRIGAGVLGLGTGAQGGTNGTLKLAIISLPRASDGTLPGTISNDTVGGINITPNSGLGWEVANGGSLSGSPGAGIQLNGATSGAVVITAPATAGSTSIVAPATSGNMVVDVATQTLKNKTYGGTTQNFQKFTSSGTFTIPANVTSVKVTVIGAGGAGGGSTVATSGGGGGSGGNTIKYLTGLTPGNTLAVTVGTGGTGVSGAGGNAGGNSTVASGTQTITSIIANGGGGGSVAAGVGVGGGGAAAGSGGDENNAGTPGALGIASISIGGGGAPSIRGGGGQATGNAGGNTGTSPGSGGGGSGAGGTNTGGTGATGLVVFEWTT